MMRVAVVRALHLGDMLCAVPALRSVRAAYPDANVSLIGLPWARELAAHLSTLVDQFLEFPGFPGIPERDVDARRITRFLVQTQTFGFDLALQLHGSGSHINEFVALLGARECAGFYEDGDAVPNPSTFVRWPSSGTEVDRLLALPRALGWPSNDTTLHLDVTTGDVEAMSSAWSTTGWNSDPQNYICIHPGARWASRRWSTARFALVADELAEQGFTIVLTGTARESAITASVKACMTAPSLDLTGRLSLGAFAALVGRARLMVCNDTGASHVAAAMRTPSVVVASGSDVERWSPQDPTRHRVLSHDVECRPCMHETCPTAHECAAGVSVEDVLREAMRLLESERAYV
jgi:ADP-heptose:LPS heptosyltransferase